MDTKTIEYMNLIYGIIISHLPNAHVLLYGSRARQDHRPGSDIDVAIDNTQAFERSILYNIIDDIEKSNLPILFDIVDMHALTEPMKKEILKDGIVWNKQFEK